MDYVGYHRSGSVFLVHRVTNETLWLNELRGQFSELTWVLDVGTQRMSRCRLAKFRIHHGSCQIWLFIADFMRWLACNAEGARKRCGSRPGSRHGRGERRRSS